MIRRYAAVDLGASSGRVVVAEVGPGTFDLREVHRFANVPVRVGRTLHWDILRIYRGVLDGLRAAGPVDGIGIDSWGVDYGLLDEEGELLGNPVHYRDSRTEGMPERLALPGLYRRTGIARQPFNTLYQLAAAAGGAQLKAARTLLLIPDLIAYWLTGEKGAELTNASTTQLLNAATQTWDEELVRAVGADPALLPPLRGPGEVIGRVREGLGLPSGTPIIAVGSHDTASAIAAVPAEGPNFAYVSCGTWSLVGVELSAPILSEESRQANFTNELGVDGTVRYLRNVSGLWLLQECLRGWGDPPLTPLLQEAELASPGVTLDVDDPRFHKPGDMPARIAQLCAETGQPVPGGRAALVRCVLDSLALSHARAVADASRLSGRAIEVVHLIGGGSQNSLLCRLTADACGLPVVSGPAEATAMGNALIQARAGGALSGDLGALRALLRRAHPRRRYEPSSGSRR